ncbi:MAG: hypothetical protein K2K75_09550 [Muribaculaceae bacterium]|nr:hypothetical protein [Muribaculaceae bacterium]
MPLPLILGIGAAIAGATGVGLGIKGAVDLSDAKDTLKKAQERDERNVKRHTEQNKATLKALDAVGEQEMRILASFEEFSKLIQKIQNKPEFANIKVGVTKIPEIDYGQLKKASVGGAILVGGLSGAALGTAGGFAASGATTAAVMALGTASTGTAISTLSGVAATNATLAALGGGSIAAGGGGMALGSAILGGATLGVGLLVGGIIFSMTGSNITGKADKAWNTMLENEKKIDETCKYLSSLKLNAETYNLALIDLNLKYRGLLSEAKQTLEKYEYNGRVEWSSLSARHKLLIENLVLIVSVLYNMCKVKLVKKTGMDNYSVNYTEINDALANGRKALASVS